MKRIRTVLMIMSLFAVPVGLMGCAERGVNDTAENISDNVQDTTDSAADSINEAAEEAADEVDDATDDR